MSYKIKNHVVKTAFDQEKIPAMVIPTDTSQKTLLNLFDSSKVQLEYTGDQVDYSYSDLQEQYSMWKQASQNTENLKSQFERYKSDQEYLSNWNSNNSHQITSDNDNKEETDGQ